MHRSGPFGVSANQPSTSKTLRDQVTEHRGFGSPPVQVQVCEHAAASPSPFSDVENRLLFNHSFDIYLFVEHLFCARHSSRFWNTE